MDEAIKNYKKAIETRPEFAFAYDRLALKYYELGLRDEAIKNYRMAKKIGPKIVSACDGLE